MTRLAQAIAAVVFLLALLPAARAAQDEASADVAQDASRPPRPVRNSAITGRVTDEAGQPIPGITVWLGSYDRTAGVHKRVLSNAAGEFRFKSLPPLAYSVFVNEERGYVREESVDGEGRRRTVYFAGDRVTLRLRKGGVITGTVTDEDGTPLILAPVQCIRIRDEQGRAIEPARQEAEFHVFTDDRGIYRKFGLVPGGYLVCAGGAIQSGDTASPLAGNTPVFYPSTTRGAASVVTVGYGDEAQSIDIRYRGARGRSVSGVVTNVPDSDSRAGIQVVVRQLDGVVVAMTEMSGTGRRPFTVTGVPDGDFEVLAFAATGEEVHQSPARRVSIRGASIANIVLTVERQPAILGQVVLDPLSESRPEGCPPKEHRTVGEILVTTFRESSPAVPVHRSNRSVPATSDGAFKMAECDRGRYRVRAVLPSDDWFVRAIGPKSTSPKALDRDSIVVASNQDVRDVIVTIGRGAAAVSGRVVPAKEGEALRTDLTVVLVPSDPSVIGDSLRYSEVRVESDGTFAMRQLAPGKYRAVVRVREDDNANDAIRRVAWTKEGRAALGKEAAASGVAVDVAPCQRVADLTLRYAGSAR